MTDVTAAHRFRKTVAGFCMIGAPVLFLVSALIAPGFESDEAAMTAEIASDPDAFATSNVLALAGWGMFAIAVLGIMHMLRERGATESHLGGGLALLGSAAAIAQTGYVLALWQSALVNEAATTSLMTAVNDSATMMVVLFILPLGVTLGGVVLAWALYRRHFVPAWIAACIGVSAIAFAVGSLAFSLPVLIAASAILLAGFGALGRMVLRESVEDWEHTPEFRGFGAAA